jgi:hypothetical protein
VAFADDFKTPDPAWVLPAQIASFSDGQLLINALGGRISRVLYPPFRFKNIVVCAELRSPPQVVDMEGSGDGGVLFWATDTSNFYLASIYPNGTYSVYRMAGDNWAQVIARTPFAGIRKGPNAVNEIQVRTKDATGTLYINGAKVVDFRGQPPKDNSIFGLYGASNNDERNEWRIISVVAGDPDRQGKPTAKAPTPAIATGCKPQRTAAFEDKFKTVDPGWGVTANSPASYAEGQFSIKPGADKVWEQLYPSLLFKNATICTTMKSPLAATDINDTLNGGLVFWAINRTNYYTADIYPNGRIGVYRMVNGAWAKLLPVIKSDVVKAGFGATNELMVSYGGDMASFHVNGKKVFEFRGQPPSTGGAFGLFAGSESGKENEWRFLDITVVENE